MVISKDLTAASSSTLVLSILAGGDSYGYQIIQSVRRLSEEKITWTDGMLYPILHRLEARKLISSYWRSAETGRKRKYYRLTEPGRKALATQREQWRIVEGALEKLWAD
jgi:PadR family transcriptional regulator, regulatory protein PadR